MKVVITGGGGFLGGQLARSLADRGELTGPFGGPEPIDELLLFDARFGDESMAYARSVNSASNGATDGPRVVLLEGDVGERDVVLSAIDRDDVAVFHLASMVSGECEVHFDEALRVNLDGGRHLLEALRAKQGTPRVVFASSVACYGGEAMPDQVSDLVKFTPQTTYGMTKAIGELMINDYTRKGFLDGRSVRLPTVIIRPGKPNAAASSWASGMFREPLAGETCHLPVHRDQLHPVIGYRDVVSSFIALHEASPDLLGDDRGFVLPSHRVTVSECLSILEGVASALEIDLGIVIDEPDPVIQSIVDSWPTATDGSRARRAGCPDPSPIDRIIRDYLEDFSTKPNAS